MGAEMQTRLKINKLKKERSTIEKTYKKRPVTSFDDARVTRIKDINAEIRELGDLLPREKQVQGKVADRRCYYNSGRRRLPQMGAEMQTRLKINKLKKERSTIEKTYKKRPVTSFDDARVTRIKDINAEIRELGDLLPREKQVQAKVADRRCYYNSGRRRLPSKKKGKKVKKNPLAAAAAAIGQRKKKGVYNKMDPKAWNQQGHQAHKTNQDVNFGQAGLRKTKY